MLALEFDIFFKFHKKKANLEKFDLFPKISQIWIFERLNFFFVVQIIF